MTATEKDCEDYAHECVRIAGHTNDPHLYEALMQMAREWMAAAIEEGGVRRTKANRLH